MNRIPSSPASRLQRVHVEEPQIALAQRDQVAVGAEVGLDVNRLAVARDREREL